MNKKKEKKRIIDEKTLSLFLKNLFGFTIEIEMREIESRVFFYLAFINKIKCKQPQEESNSIRVIQNHINL